MSRTGVEAIAITGSEFADNNLEGGLGADGWAGIAKNLSYPGATVRPEFQLWPENLSSASLQYLLLQSTFVATGPDPGVPL